MDLQSLHPLTKHLEGTERLRVREKQHNGFFGRIFKEDQKSLKQNNIKDHSTIVVQILDAPERLEKDSYVLWFSKRNIETRTYTDYREVILQGKRLKDLALKALEVYSFESNLEGVEPDHIQMAKHQPHNFKWQYLDPEESITEKNKKGKQGKTFKVSEIDLKQNPILLKDGDEVGFYFGSEGDKVEDWQTEEDKLFEEEFIAGGGKT